MALRSKSIINSYFRRKQIKIKVNIKYALFQQNRDDMKANLIDT